MDNLLRAYAHLIAEHPTALLFVGEVRKGEDQERFNELRASMRNERVIVTGQNAYQDLPSFYSLMDVFVHPSLRDGMPNALLEAMACEKSVIAAPVGGITDVIEHKKNGMLIHLNDANNLTDNLCELLNNKEKRTQLGQATRATVANRFTLDRELSANLNIYRSLGLPA